MDMCYLACAYRTPSGYCGSTGGAATCPHRQKKHTNADRILDKECVVRETIDNLRGTGAVAVDGKVWTARMLNEDETAREGEIVIARRIDGVKLIVERA